MGETKVIMNAEGTMPRGLWREGGWFQSYFQQER